MVYLPTEFHTPSSSCSLVTAIKLIGKGHFSRPPCYITFYQKKITYVKYAYSPKIYYHTLFQDPNVSGVHIAPASQVHMFAILLLPIVGNQKFGFRVSSNGMAWRPSFVKIKQFNNWNERHKSDTYRMAISHGYTFSSSGIKCKLIKLAWRHLRADSCHVSATVIYWNLNTLLRGQKNKQMLQNSAQIYRLPFFTSFGKWKL